MVLKFSLIEIHQEPEPPKIGRLRITVILPNLDRLLYAGEDGLQVGVDQVDAGGGQHLGDAPHVGAHHRQPAGEGLHDGHAEGLG